jgi:type IV pilus assembly protein PilC
MSMLLIWPLIEYFGAIFVITLLIFIMGMIGTQDVLGWGLTGTKGALIFLGGMMAFTAVLFFGYRYIRDTPAMQAKVEAFLLPIPILGSCFRTFALQRFCSALYMTNEAGFDSGEMVRSSLRAATNQRYLDIANDSCKQVRKGREISEVLAVHGTRLFPDDLIQSIHLGEETGSLAEVMKKEMIRFREEAGRQMLILALIFTALVILMIAAFIIFMIYSIYTQSIGPVYRDAMMAVDDPQKWLQQGGGGQLQEHMNAADDPQKWLRGGR